MLFSPRPNTSLLFTSSMLWSDDCKNIEEYYHKCVGVPPPLLPTVLGLKLAVDLELGSKYVRFRFSGIFSPTIPILCGRCSQTQRLEQWTPVQAVWIRACRGWFVLTTFWRHLWNISIYIIELLRVQLRIYNSSDIWKFSQNWTNFYRERFEIISNFTSSVNPLLNPVWNHWLSLQCDWLSVVL